MGRLKKKMNAETPGRILLLKKQVTVLFCARQIYKTRLVSFIGKAAWVENSIIFALTFIKRALNQNS